jgi:hypothetical protein
MAERGRPKAPLVLTDEERPTLEPRGRSPGGRRGNSGGPTLFRARGIRQMALAMVADPFDTRRSP